MNRTITVPEDYIAIPITEYVELINDGQILAMMLNCLFDNAYLSYDKSELRFSDNSITALLKSSQYATRYRLNLEELKSEVEDE